MVSYDINPLFTIPVIDVPATSKNLKLLREKHNITVAEIQKLFGMENPQSIYTWDRERHCAAGQKQSSGLFLASLEAAMLRTPKANICPA
ncbi:MAG: hypothetical protein IJP90_12055 [Treponema sp.]|nr:hypothetical protein [Treponema sp.]